MIWMERVKAGKDKTSPDIIRMAKAAAAKKRKEYSFSKVEGEEGSSNGNPHA
jgi:hypothetical protein